MVVFGTLWLNLQMEEMLFDKFQWALRTLESQGGLIFTTDPRVAFFAAIAIFFLPAMILAVLVNRLVLKEVLAISMFEVNTLKKEILLLAILVVFTTLAYNVLQPIGVSLGAIKGIFIAGTVMGVLFIPAIVKVYKGPMLSIVSALSFSIFAGLALILTVEMMTGFCD